MERTIVQTTEFSKRWDALGLNDDDLRRLELDILRDPSKYPIIQGTGGLRKVRFAIEHKGKRGSIRVCYVDFVLTETIYLITVYSKGEKENLTNAERNYIKAAVNKLKKNTGGKRNEPEKTL